MALGDFNLSTQIQSPQDAWSGVAYAPQRNTQPQNLQQWLQSPEGQQAYRQAQMQAQQAMAADRGLGEGGSGVAGQMAPIQFQTPFGTAQYLSNGSGGGQIMGSQKQWNQDYQTDGQRAEVPTFTVNPDGSLGQAGFNETRGGGLSGTNNQLAMFAALAGGGALAAGAGAGAAGGAAGGTAAGGTAAGGSGVAAGMEAAGLATAAGGASGSGAAAGGAAGGLGNAAGAASGLGGYGQYIAPALGAIAGASQSGPQTSSSAQQLPDWLKPAAQQYTNQAMQLAGSPTQAYTGQLGAGTNEYQNQAIGGLQRLASGGDKTTNAGANYTQGVLSGQYLNSNPYLDSMYDNAAKRITDNYSRGTAAQTDAMFVRGGAYGGSAHADTTQQNQRALGDSLSQFASNLYGNNYAQERQNQQQAAQLAPTYGAENRTNQQALGSAGNTFQQTQQNQNNMQYQEFQRQQDDQYRRLQALGGVFGNVGEQNRTQTTPGTGLAAGIIGGAAQGAGIYGQGQRAGWW